MRRAKIVPGHPGKMAAQFPCPFCTGTAFYGNRALIAASAGQLTRAADDVAVAHTKPSCDTFKQKTAGEFVKACLARIRQ